MVAIDLFLHDVFMELGKDLRGEDILPKDAVIFFHTVFITYPKEFLRIAGLGFLVHRSHIENGVILVFPDTREDAIVTDLSKGYGMDGDHQGIITLVFLDHLEGTGFVGVTAIEGIAQKQQDRFVTSKLGCLIDGMTEAPLLTLIDIMEVFSDIENTCLEFLCLWIEFVQMFIR